MSVVRINAIDVPAEAGDELAHRFAARMGEVDGADGFEEFQLLKPTDGRTTWLAYTRWRDEEAFAAWLASASFTRSHARGAGQAGPVGTHSEMWSFDVAR